jgi:hypothetical protein
MVMNEPTKVYIVTQGDYSDCRNIGVFTTREAAEAVGGDVEEWLLDNVAGAPGHYTYFSIFMDREGNTRYAAPMEYVGRNQSKHNFIPKEGWPIRRGIDMSDCLECEVWAKDILHAVKIVNEKRAQFIAENKWGVN